MLYMAIFILRSIERDAKYAKYNDSVMTQIARLIARPFKHHYSHVCSYHHRPYRNDKQGSMT